MGREQEGILPRRDRGDARPLKAGDEFEVLRVNKLDRDTYWATPAADDASLFVRCIDSLYRIDAKK